MRSGTTCLLVGENDDLRAAAVAALAPEQGTVIEVPNAELALFELLRQPVDLILVDASGLPGMSAADLCREVRSRGATPVITAMPVRISQEVAAGLDAGASDHITTPLDPAELRARMRAVLRRLSLPVR